MGSKDRRERERLDTRRRILDASRDMFVRYGYEATTMRSIADRVEYTPTALYHHFENKQALLTELCLIDFRALSQALKKIGQVADPVERLRRIGQAYVEFGTDHPMQYQLMFLTPRPDVIISPGVREPPKDPGEDAYAFLLQTCSDAIVAGRFRSNVKDPHQIAQVVWAGWHGLVSLQIVHGKDEFMKWRDLRSAVKRFHDLIIAGLQNPDTA
jgi:AcrR family transcriptional regulator